MIVRRHLCKSATACRPTTSSSFGSRRWLSSPSSGLLSRPVQSYISSSNDPYLNLSIEHHLLQNTAQHSVVLFLYVNRPSVIIGRNQNPWVEVNLALLNASRDSPETEPPGLGAVDLVRRRSGGGTVFHDTGNVNWTVVCPSASFTRDKHAEMVVRALRGCGVDRARVNARHDIVLDQGSYGSKTHPDDTHSTPYEATSFEDRRPVKVSGSAYKLTRNRALHHGTCLLASPNLQVIPHYLHSPAKPYISARGVESVSSPVGNVMLSNQDFMDAVQAAFAKQYDVEDLTTAEVGDEWLEQGDVRKGYDELQTPDWTYLQTPQFTVSTKGTDLVDLELFVRYGAITGGSFLANSKTTTRADLPQEVHGLTLHTVQSWAEEFCSKLKDLNQPQQRSLANWLHEMLRVAE